MQYSKVEMFELIGLVVFVNKKNLICQWMRENLANKYKIRYIKNEE